MSAKKCWNLHWCVYSRQRNGYQPNPQKEALCSATSHESLTAPARRVPWRIRKVEVHARCFGRPSEEQPCAPRPHGIFLPLEIHLLAACALDAELALLADLALLRSRRAALQSLEERPEVIVVERVTRTGGRAQEDDFERHVGFALGIGRNFLPSHDRARLLLAETLRTTRVVDVGHATAATRFDCLHGTIELLLVLRVEETGVLGGLALVLAGQDLGEDHGLLGLRLPLGVDHVDGERLHQRIELLAV